MTCSQESNSRKLCKQWVAAAVVAVAAVVFLLLVAVVAVVFAVVFAVAAVVAAAVNISRDN